MAEFTSENRLIIKYPGLIKVIIKNLCNFLENCYTKGPQTIKINKYCSFYRTCFRRIIKELRNKKPVLFSNLTYSLLAMNV